MQTKTEINEAVQIYVPVLVRLNRQAGSLPLHQGQVRARQGGDYQSPFKGRGMEFDESRFYQPGDDIRNIDWRVTARTGKTHTKLFREERERPVFVWVDLRTTMFFATRGKFKSVLASHLACILAWSAVYSGDRIGGVVFSDDNHHELKPMRGKSGALRLINQLVQHPAWQNKNINVETDKPTASKALIRLRRVVRPGSLVFLVSDFRYFDELAESQAVRLSQHNDVVMLFIHDPLEVSLPDSGKYRISNTHKELTIDTFDHSLTEQYQQRFLERRERLVTLSRKHKIRLIDCSTEHDPFSILQSGLVSHHKK